MVGKSLSRQCFISLLSGCNQDLEAGRRTGETKLTRVVRNDIGELKWMLSESSDYTSTVELTRLMTAMTQWVAPKEGCLYCQLAQDYASDALHAKVVARRAARARLPRTGVAVAGPSLLWMVALYKALGGGWQYALEAPGPMATAAFEAS